MPDNHDIATVNRKGLLPKLSGSATDVLLGTGAFGAPPSGGTEFLFTADPDTGFSNPSANTIKVITGNAEAWRFLSTGEMRGPDAATSSSNGTARIIRGGPGGSSSGNGGDVTLIGGTPTDGKGGSLNILGGDAVGTAQNGGSLLCQAGTGITSGSGGSVFFQGGTGGATGGGGSFNIAGGAGGGTSGNAGDVSLAGGTPVDGNGGSAVIRGKAGVGTDRNGGDILVFTGANTGSGVSGNFDVSPASAVSAPAIRVNGTTKHISHMGTAPTITAGGGTGPAIAGKDESFLVTVGTGGLATSVEVTFANAFTNAPQCSANHQGEILVLRCVSLTNKVTIDAATPFTASGKIDVICRGYE